MNEEEKLIQEQFAKLPKNLQVAITAVPWKSLVNEIALLNKLGLDQVETIERETMFIIYGFENPDDYIENIMREAPISEETAITIATAVNERVLKAIATKVEEFERGEMGKTGEKETNLPEIAPNNLPMVEKGEIVHEVKPMTEEEKSSIKGWSRKPWSAQTPEASGGDREEQTKVSTPNYSYPNNKDPYREPLV